MESLIFAFGCGVSFLCLAGVYVWARRGLAHETAREVQEPALQSVGTPTE